MVKNITIDFTYTKRDEFLSKKNKNIIYKDGTFLGDPNNTFNILIEGGDDLFQHQKLLEESSAFYITQSQIASLYSILKSLSLYSDQLQINSDNEQLKTLCYSIFRNLNG